jgi:GDP-4-dehydro-6-deoxy-D-mannose reductase
MTTALVTGSLGWVGRYLTATLTAEGYHTVGIDRLDSDAADYLRVDLTDADAVATALASVHPDLVFHLAAATPQRVPDPAELTAGCVVPTQTVCAGLRKLDYAPRIVLVGSSAQYGKVPEDQNPVTEDTPQQPVGAYGFAKIAAEAVAQAMAADNAYHLLRVRAFNHIGPGEPPATMAGALARRVVDVLLGNSERITVSDLDAVRDFTDVRDIARGYLAVAREGIPGAAYNLCSGRPVTVRDVLAGLLECAGLDWSIVDMVAGAGGIPYQVGSTARISSATSWKPEIPLARSLADLLDSVTPTS